MGALKNVYIVEKHKQFKIESTTTTVLFSPKFGLLCECLEGNLSDFICEKVSTEIIDYEDDDIIETALNNLKSIFSYLIIIIQENNLQ